MGLKANIAYGAGKKIVNRIIKKLKNTTKSKILRCASYFQLSSWCFELWPKRSFVFDVLHHLRPERITLTHIILETLLDGGKHFGPVFFHALISHLLKLVHNCDD